MKFKISISILLLSIFNCKNNEKLFLDRYIKEINVVMDNNYPPYIFLDEDGNYQGILIDQWKLWEKKTNIKVNIFATDWIEAQKLMKKVKFDVIDTIFKTEERLKIYDYSKPYAKINVPIFYHKNITGIIKLNFLKGFSIGVKEGDACIDILKKNNLINLVEYKNYEDIIKSAKNKDIVVFTVDEPPALYFMYKYGIQNEFKSINYLYSGEFHRAVLKGNKRILDIVEIGFNAISNKEYKNIDEKWFGKDKFEFKYFKYVLIFLFILILAFFIMLILIFLLRYTIKIKTKDLLEEIKKNEKIQMELKETKDLYKLLSEITSDGASLLTLNKDGSFNIEWFTINLLNEYGYNIKDIDSFEKWSKIVYKEDIDKFHSAVKKILKGEKISEDIRIVAKDNRIRWINNTIYPILDKETKEVKKLLSSIKDITEKKKIEDELKSAKEEAERYANIKSKFLSNMSHEIRNPLNNMLAMIKMLLNTNLSKKQREYINMLKDSGDILLNIINDILDLSKIESGKRVIKKDILKLKKLCNNLITSFNIAANKKNIKLNFIYDKEIPEYIISDSSILNQIFLNLLSNAIKFTEKGYITFEVKKIDEDDKMVNILFIVDDTGIGIPQDKIYEIFERFTQIDLSYTKKYKGTGLGLTIVKELVQLLKGEIKVESILNKGTKFFIKLNLEKYISNLEFNNLEKKEKEIEINEKDYNIIIAEDSPINLLFLDTILKNKGYNTFTAKDGKEVLKILEKNRIDLILMDIQMPVLDGVKCTKILKNEKKLLIPIIAITGYTMPEDLKIFRESGIDDYISKPISEDILFEKINKLLLTLNK